MQAVELGKVQNIVGCGDLFLTDEGRHFTDFSPWHGRRVLVVDLGPAEEGLVPMYVKFPTGKEADDGDA